MVWGVKDLLSATLRLPVDKDVLPRDLKDRGGCKVSTVTTKSRNAMVIGGKEEGNAGNTFTSICPKEFIPEIVTWNDKGEGGEKNYSSFPLVPQEVKFAIAMILRAT